MTISLRFLIPVLCVGMFPFAVFAQNISSQDVARVANQYNQMSDAQKAALLSMAKQKYDSMSDQEKAEIVNKIKNASSGTQYESQVLQMEKKLRGDNIPDSMKQAIESPESGDSAQIQQPVVEPLYQKPALEQAQTFIQDNENRLSDNQKKGMKHWKEQLEAQEKMHQQYLDYMQKQRQQ